MPTKSKSIIMPAMQSGGDANIVYSISIVPPDHRSCSILRRYDVITHKTVDIATFTDEGIFDAEISPDGQWILLVTSGGCAEVDIIRMDGLYLQTLYGFCEAQGPSQWSPDQHSVVFDLIGQSQRFDLIDMTTGKIQTELVEYPPPYSTSYDLHSWLDTKRVYVVDGFTGQASIMLQHLYILDTRKGPDQHTSDLQFVTQLASPYAWSFDSSYDGSSLFISRCHCTADAQTGKISQQGPSSISAMPATGGSQQNVYSSASLAITDVRAIDEHTLLFLVQNTSGETSQNGLWKINSDGTGLIRLTTEKVGESSSFNHNPPYYQPYPWSNVSRDGTMYALDFYNAQTHVGSLLVGSLRGGSPTSIAAGESTHQPWLVGWTTL